MDGALRSRNASRTSRSGRTSRRAATAAAITRAERGSRLPCATAMSGTIDLDALAQFDSGNDVAHQAGCESVSTSGIDQQEAAGVAVDGVVVSHDRLGHPDGDLADLVELESVRA